MEHDRTTLKDELIDLCRQGDVDAFTALYHRYAKEVYSSIFRVVGHMGESEDVLQETFVSVFKQINSFDERNYVGAWIKRIALNKAISLLRKKKIVFYEINDTHQPADEEIIDEEDFEFKVEEVKKAIAELPKGYRTIVTLHLIEDISQEEIGKMLGVSHATVRSQYHRAKASILKYLKRSKDE